MLIFITLKMNGSRIFHPTILKIYKFLWTFNIAIAVKAMLQLNAQTGQRFLMIWPLIGVQHYHPRSSLHVSSQIYAEKTLKGA